jgi:predicted metal-dependent hydrolase
MGRLAKREFISWHSVERAMPDWDQRRRWLAERGRQFTI